MGGFKDTWEALMTNGEGELCMERAKDEWRGRKMNGEGERWVKRIEVH
jgi:hypothetical protein